MARILHVVASPRAEGTPRLVLDWLAVRGHEQSVLFLAGNPPDLLAEFRGAARTVEVCNVLVPGWRKFPAIFRAAREQVRGQKPDLVIAWPMGYSHWVFLGARAAGTRASLLSHCGNPPGIGWKHRFLLTWVCLWTTRACAGRVVACSRYVQGRFRGVPLVPSSVLGFAYNCVQTSIFASRSDAARRSRHPDGRFRAVMVATLEGHKDHATLIRAAGLLRARGLGIDVLLAGAGSLEAPLRALAAELGVEGTVVFLGARSDVPEVLGGCDVFVLSTTPSEGRPGVIMEALAAGLPIIASDVEPLREVLENGRWGTLVPPGNPEALADSLAAASRSGPPDARRVAELRSHAAGFTPERMIADYLREAGMVPENGAARPAPIGLGGGNRSVASLDT
jgi:glycosyltransferase involved in cell wall biosynthesis